MSTAAQQLSQWIERTHPGLFDVVYGHVQQRIAANTLRQARSRGFGDDGDFVLDPNVVNFDDVLSQTAVQPLDLTNDINAGFADTDFISSGFSPPTVDIPTLNPSDLQLPGVTGGSSSTINTSFSPPSTDTGTFADSGAGFLQTIGSGIASAAVSVGKFLTSPDGVKTVGAISQAYFQLENNKVNAQLQQQVLTSQIARASIGLPPNPITYVKGTNGQMVPVYQTSPLSSVGIYPGNMPPALQNAIQSGQAQLVTLPDGSTGYTIPGEVLNQMGGYAMPSWLPWALILGVALILG